MAVQTIHARYFCSMAFFVFPNEDNVRLVPGDELKLKYEIDGQVKWKSRGHIVKITANEEICLEVKNAKALQRMLTPDLLSSLFGNQHHLTG